MAIQYSGSIASTTLTGNIDAILNSLHTLLSDAGWTTLETYPSVAELFVISFPVDSNWIGNEGGASKVVFKAMPVGACEVDDHVGEGGLDDPLSAMQDAAAKFASCINGDFTASAARDETGALILTATSSAGPHNVSEFTTSGGWSNWNTQPSDGGYLMQSPTVSGTSLKVKFTDATHGTIDLIFYSDDDAFESMVYRINPDKTYFAAATKAGFYIGLPGGGGDGDGLYAGIPLTEMNSGTITKAWFIVSGSEFFTTLRWSSEYTIFSNEFGFDGSVTSVADPRLVFPHYINSANPLIDTADCALICEPLIAFGLAGVRSTAVVVGQLFDAIVITKSFALDTEHTFDEKTWRCIASQAGGGFSPAASLWLAVE